MVLSISIGLPAIMSSYVFFFIHETVSKSKKVQLIRLVSKSNKVQLIGLVSKSKKVQLIRLVSKSIRKCNTSD